VEIIARLITRYREFERQYLERKKSALQSTLEEALTSLYVEILTYLAWTVSYFKDNSLSMFYFPFVLR
jgi:hypothetical protein